MLVPVHVRDLQVDPAHHPRAQAHVSSASGLAIAGGWLYVVADDEHHIGAFKPDARGQPVTLHRVLPGDLPAGKGERKKLKPDFEALVLLEPHVAYPHGALLALGSGSTAARRKGALVGLKGDGGLAGPARVVDLAGLHEPLRAQFPDLNIEGAFFAGDRFFLLQRGNRGDARNAAISYSAAAIYDWLAGRDSTPECLGITEFDLGDIRGVPFGFTDGTGLPDGSWLFSAVAEDTADSYNDGACAGSAIGWVGRNDELQNIEWLEGSPKVEGIALDGAGQLLMVTDQDDPASASRLLSVAPQFSGQNRSPPGR